MEQEELEQLIKKETLINAIKFDGKANMGAVMGKIMGENPNLRPQAKDIKNIVLSIVKEANQMSVQEQKNEVLKMDPHSLDEKESEIEEKGLPDLPNAEKDKVVMRLAPYPSGALHIGNARMIVLNDEYVKRYNGKLLLVFDDTIGTTLEKIDDPNAKYVIPEAYDLITEGLDWLGVNYHETYYKSDRVEIYQEEAGKLIDKGQAYVCTCEAKVFSTEYKRTGKECPCRGKSLEYHQDMYDKMKSGGIGEGGAVVRLKTGMDQKDPAMRDHIIMRISDAPHPRIGTKYRLWPILEWSWGLDDHLLGVTHIIRGIDLRKEGEVEKFIWDLYGWEPAHITLYGRLKFENMKLSKTRARRKVRAGEFEGWSDPRTWSLQSIRERGIGANCVREALLDLGLSKRGIVFDEEWIYAKNTPVIDPIANRYWYVENPRKLVVSDINIGKKQFTAHPLVNPSNESKGTRDIILPIDKRMAELFISEEELGDSYNYKGKLTRPKLEAGEIIRLKDFFNVKLSDLSDPMNAVFDSIEKIDNTKIIQAVPAYNNINVRVLQPDGKITTGLGESNLRGLKEEDMIQFIRYGFVKVKKITQDEIYCYFTHS